MLYFLHPKKVDISCFFTLSSRKIQTGFMEFTCPNLVNFLLRVALVWEDGGSLVAFYTSAVEIRPS